jgi:class 3 adenylate cyclase
MAPKDPSGGMEVVDLSQDPREARAERRRRIGRVVLPMLTAALLIGAALATIAINHVNSRRDALALADSVLQALEKRIVTEIENWLSPAERAVRLLYEAEKRGAFTRGVRLAEPLSMALLNSVRHVSIVSIADSEGNYFMFRRNAVGGIDTKVITQTPARRVVNTIRDADGTVIRTYEDPQDRFDPRTRPWYLGAAASDGVHWTEIYVFFTDRVPGLTVSVAVRDESGALKGVFGADIRLDALSAFLAGLAIGETGRAMIIDRRGTLVAFPDAERAIKQVGDTLSPVHLDELNDSVLTRAFNVFRVEGPGRRTVEVDGERHLTIAAPVPDLIGNDWTVLIVVPEDEFVGFVTRNSRLALLAAAVVGVFTLALADMLVRQGLRADRNARLLSRRSGIVAARSDAFATLAADAALVGTGSEKALQRCTETIARTLGARRVSVWRFSASHAALRCEDGFDAERHAHAAGTRLGREEVPQGFTALLESTVDVTDAAREPALAGLHRAYLQPLDSRALLSVPIRAGGETVGLLWVEDRAADADGAVAFATAAATLLAPHMTGVQAPQRIVPLEAPTALAAAGGAAPRPRRHLPGDGVLGRERAQVFMQRLTERGIGERGLAAEVFRDVTVLVLEFTDAIALADAAPDAPGSPLADQAIRIVQEVTASHGIEYLRLSGESVVAADGFVTGGPDRAAAVAAAALDLQGRLAALFHAANQRLGFRIGIDTGTVIGSAVGADGRTFNIWGEAVRTARAMAMSSPEAAIQVSGTTHEAIASTCLMRPRGRFWIEGAGEIATYILTARA